MKISPKHKSLFWIVLVLAILVLSWIGLASYFPETSQWRYLPDRIFRMIKILMGNDPTLPRVEPPDVPMVLIVVKILVILLLLRAMLKVVENVFHEQYTQWRIAFKKDHAIVVGIGGKGSHILGDYLEKTGRGAVAIERHSEHENLPALRRDGHAVLIGDAASEDMLENAGALRARHLICLARDEQTGIEVAGKLVSLYRRKASGHTLHCHIHLNQPRLAETLQRYGQAEQENGVNIRFFNLHNMVARRFFHQLPHTLAAHLQQPQAQVHFLLFGFGHAAQALLVQGLRVFHLLPGQQRHWHIISPGMAAKAAIFHDRYPQAEHILPLNWHEDDGCYAGMLAAFMRDLSPGASVVAICADDDDKRNLHIAAELLQASPHADFVIHVRNGGGKEMGGLLHGPARERLLFFGDDSDFCRYELITGDRQDRLARAIHQDYLGQTDGSASESAAYQRAWQALDEDGKDANRAQADHIPYKLLLAGQLSALAQGQAPVFAADMLEALAATEHERWAAHRYLNGWQYGETRDDRARKHPSLIPWEALSEAEKQKDRNTILRLPYILRGLDDVAL